MGSAHRAGGSLSDHGFQSLAVQQVEQLERRPARMLFADLPLPNCRKAGVQNRRQDSLADLVLRISAKHTDDAPSTGGGGASGRSLCSAQELIGRLGFD